MNLRTNPQKTRVEKRLDYVLEILFTRRSNQHDGETYMIIWFQREPSLWQWMGWNSYGLWKLWEWVQPQFGFTCFVSYEKWVQRGKIFKFKASLPYNKWVPQCYVPWVQIHYWPSGHVGLVHGCRLIFVHVSVWSFTLLGSDMKMLTGRSVAVFKSSQDVHSALLDAAVPIRWRVSLETDCGREKEFWISLPNIQNPLARGWKGKQKTSQNASHQGLMLSQSW